MTRPEVSLPPALMRCLGWMIVALCALLGCMGLGGVILRLTQRRYRDLAIYIAFGVFTLLCVACPIYLAGRKAARPGVLLRRMALGLACSAIVWCVFTGVFLWNYNGERLNDGWYAPPENIIFNDGYLVRTHIVVYAPGNALWTGPELPDYEYID